MSTIDQVSIEKNVRMIAKHYPAFLNVENRKRAIVYYLENFEGVKFPLSTEDFFKIKSVESITRAIRKIAEETGKKSALAVDLQNQYSNYYSREYERL